MLIGYVLNNSMKFEMIRQVLNTYMRYELLCEEYKNKFGKNYSRINDFDGILQEILQVMVLNLIVNTVAKYKSDKSHRREDAMTTAKLACSISS